MSAIVGNQVVRCVTQALPDQWFVIDFGSARSVQPTHYTLRHYSSWDTEALRNWRLQGAIEADPHRAQWVTISEHKEDLEALAQGLLEYETLSGDEIRKLLQGEPPVRDSGDVPPTPARGSPVPSTGRGRPRGTDGGLEPSPQPQG